MGRKIIGFKLQGEEFAFEIMKIVEIIRMKDVTEIPTAPGFIEGVINLRGKIIPIIDLRKRFKIEEKVRGGKNRIIIVEFQKSQLVGVIVDEVSKVINVKDDDVLPAPASISSVGGRYIEAIVKQEDKIIVLLNIEKVFSEEEQEGLVEIAKSEGGQLENGSNS